MTELGFEARTLEQDLRTAREEIEELRAKLRDSEKECERSKLTIERFADVVANMPIGLHLYRLENLKDDRSLKLVATNPAAEAFTGVPRSEVIGKTIDQNFPGLRELGIPEIYADVVRTGRARMLSDVLYGDNRVTKAFFSVRAFPILGDCVGVVFENITERKVAEQQLKKKENEYRSLFRKMLNGFAYHRVLLDDSGKPVDYVFLEVNDAFIKLTGLERNALIGRPVSEVLPGIEKDPADWIGRYGKVALGGGDIRFENFSEPLGKWFSIYAYSPAPQHFAVIFEEITDRKKAQDALREKEEQLHHAMKMEAIGRLAGGVAHDFNNILTAINGFSEIMVDAIAPDDPLAEDLEEIRSAGARAADLTNQLLMFSRKQIISPKLIRPEEAIQSSMKMLRRIIGEDVELTVRAASGKHRVKIDPAQLDQILINLVVNARDAMPRGGALIIDVSEAQVDNYTGVGGLTAKSGDYVRISVIDEGEGIEPSKIEMIFEPFYSTKKEGEGTGLGLATVYGIVQQNLGVIRVESEIGRGTTVEVLLPAIVDAVEVQRQGNQKSGFSGSETVLLVEDNDTVRHLAARILAKKGYSVIASSSGEQALELAQEHDGSIELLLTDVIMPAMNGRELYDRIRPFRPSIRVLYMSGYSGEIIANHGVIEAETNFVSKPFRVEELSKKVREVLDGVTGQD